MSVANTGADRSLATNGSGHGQRARRGWAAVPVLCFPGVSGFLSLVWVWQVTVFSSRSLPACPKAPWSGGGCGLPPGRLLHADRTLRVSGHPAGCSRAPRPAWW